MKNFVQNLKSPHEHLLKPAVMHSTLLQWQLTWRFVLKLILPSLNWPWNYENGFNAISKTWAQKRDIWYGTMLKGALKMTIFTCLSKSENIAEYLYIHMYIYNACLYMPMNII